LGLKRLNDVQIPGRDLAFFIADFQLDCLLSGMASYRSKIMQQQSPLSLSAALICMLADGWKAN
jgi:hypothetical protein